MPMSSRDGRRVTALDGWLAPEEEPPNLIVRPDAEVASVIVDHGRAAGVRLVDGTAIAAGWVVLAAGTYGSPSILQRSGIGPADELTKLGLSVAVDLPGVGANLADHPAIDFDTGWRGAVPDGRSLHSIATYRSALAAAGDAFDLMYWLSDPAGQEPRFYLDPILLRPRSRGSVRLRSADPGEPPRISLPGLREAADLDRLAEGYGRAVELANLPVLRRLASNPPPLLPTGTKAIRRGLIENAYSIPHVVGTCAMGGSPANGAVVDELGRVHGTDRLSVIDASIIPEPPSGFPHLVTLMLAERLAQRLPSLLR
jgi:choline dehydrogenase